MSKRSRKQRRELERRDVTFERKETLPAPVVLDDETRALDALGEIVERKVGKDESRQPRFTSPASLRADPDSYLNSIATIMSSGGDMPEFALTLLSSMPDRWDIDIWTQILMRGYALAFGYQSSEFYPEPAGVMGRGKEQEIQQRSATGKGGKDFALSHLERPEPQG